MTNNKDKQVATSLDQRQFRRLEAWRLYMRTAWNRAFGLNVTRITDDLYVGGQFTPEQWLPLYALGIRAVLSLQEEYEDRFSGTPPERSLRLLVPDFHPPSLQQLAEACAFISAAHDDDLPVMVHCHAGMGRAPLTAAAYLIQKGGKADEVLNNITRLRPIVGLNERQLERLYEWEKYVRQLG